MGETTNTEINADVGAILLTARKFLEHEHSLFRNLGLEPLMIGRGETRFGVDMPGDFAAPDGHVHPSLITIVMDSIFGVTVFTNLKELTPIATINLHVNYLADVAPGARVVCNATVDGSRNDIATVSGDLRRADGGGLVATGAGAFMIGTRTSAKGSRL